MRILILNWKELAHQLPAELRSSPRRARSLVVRGHSVTLFVARPTAGPHARSSEESRSFAAGGSSVSTEPPANSGPEQAASGYDVVIDGITRGRS
jgi:hypothetical protein